MYMATWPVCVEMAQALRGISDLSRFKDLSFKDLKQKLVSYYPFSNIQIRRVDAYLNLKPQVTVISSSSTSAHEDDDLPMVGNVTAGNGVVVSYENEALPLVSVSAWTHRDCGSKLPMATQPSSYFAKAYKEH